MSKWERELLARWADYGRACSPWELLGATANGAAVAGAVHALRDAGLLEQVPWAAGADPHGGHRFRVTAAGWAALGRTPPGPAVARADRVGRLPGPSRNGTYRRGA